MELTPELFEKTEFAERRRGYDIDQVERFLEDAGTELAKLLVGVRRTEERAHQAEARLADAEAAAAQARERADSVEARARSGASDRSAAAALSEEAEVAQAAKTLLMARRTAEATESEARSQAQALLAETKSRADRQLNDAQAEADELLRQGRRRAEDEFSERRSRVLEDVESLESRRTQLADIVSQLEGRLASYREDLTRTAEELTLLASDPDRLGTRPPLSVAVDEVYTPSSEPGPEPEVDLAPEPDEDPDESDTGRSDVEGVETFDLTDSGDEQGTIETTSMTAEHRAVVIDTEGGPPTESIPSTPLDPGAHTFDIVPSAEEPVTGSQEPARDRYLQDLDDAVNESDESDEAMTAFFEGSNESPNRRFGWRR